LDIVKVAAVLEVGVLENNVIEGAAGGVDLMVKAELVEVLILPATSVAISLTLAVVMSAVGIVQL
jgi:hypothetical protein